MNNYYIGDCEIDFVKPKRDVMANCQICSREFNLKWQNASICPVCLVNDIYGKDDKDAQNTESPSETQRPGVSFETGTNFPEDWIYRCYKAQQEAVERPSKGCEKETDCGGKKHEDCVKDSGGSGSEEGKVNGKSVESDPGDGGVKVA